MTTPWLHIALLFLGSSGIVVAFIAWVFREKRHAGFYRSLRYGKAFELLIDVPKGRGRTVLLKGGDGRHWGCLLHTVDRDWKRGETMRIDRKLLGDLIPMDDLVGYVEDAR